MSEVKIAVLGYAAVGKSAISYRFIQGTFVEVYDPTIENIYTKTVDIDGKSYSLDLLDTAGMEAVTSLKESTFRSKDAFLLVYSVVDRVSFTEVQTYYDEILRSRNQ